MKLYQVKRFCENHEIQCHKNPSNYVKCLDMCKHLIKKDYEFYYDTPYGENLRILKLFYCQKKKIFLYPPRAGHKKNVFDLGDELNEPMKKDCD